MQGVAKLASNFSKFIVSNFTKSPAGLYVFQKWNLCAKIKVKNDQTREEP